MDYKTKQKDAILNYLNEQKERYVTAKELLEHLKAKNIEIGLTTIYRHLEKLEAKGLVRKYHLDGELSACYKACAEQENFLLKCEDCGDMVEFKCPDLEHLYTHFNDEHHFAINPHKTVFYGKCGKCKLMEV
ncbi:MAG: transcriptional repressor [Clostridia bacterium]|nr:transcriptional repressor [Clostridia bacterium]